MFAVTPCDTTAHAQVAQLVCVRSKSAVASMPCKPIFVCVVLGIGGFLRGGAVGPRAGPLAAGPLAAVRVAFRGLTRAEVAGHAPRPVSAGAPSNASWYRTLPGGQRWMPAPSGRYQVGRDGCSPHRMLLETGRYQVWQGMLARWMLPIR